MSRSGYVDNRTISRTGEKVLGIIGIVFNVITIILFAWLLSSLAGLEGTAEFDQFEEDIMNDPAFEGSPEEAQLVVDFIVNGAGVFGWAIVALLVISTILAIVALLNLKKASSAGLAGTFFIIAGLFAGVLSLTSILFYIAAIMCFVRKPPKDDDELHRKDEVVYREDTVRETDDPIYRENDVRRTDDSIRSDDTRRDDDTPYRPL